MRIPILGIEIKRSKPKNQTLDPATYTRTDFWNDISNAVSTDKGMKIAAVYRCIDVLSDMMSMLPWTSVDTRSKEKPDDRYSQQIWYLLNVEPNRNMTPAVFFKTLEQQRLNGNAYAEIITAGNGIPTELLIINPERVHPKELDNGDIVYDVTEKKGNSRRLLSDEILHFKNISDDGLVGKSVLSFASDCITNMSSQEEFNRNFYENGGVLGGVLEYDTDLAGKDMQVPEGHPHYGKSLKDAMRDSFENHISKSKRVAKIAVLDRGGKYHEIKPISQKDMAFIESKESSVADVCRFYGVPLYMVFAGKESYQSNEQNNIAFVTGKFNPIATGYEQELTRKLLSPDRRRAKVQIKANLNVLLRGDIAARTNHYEKMRFIGVYSANDIRRFEDMDDVEGGDIRFASWNYGVLEDFKEQSANRNAPKTQTGGEKNENTI